MNKLYRKAVAWRHYFKHKSTIDHDKVIIKFDGGICSQIAFWALAKEISENGCGVKYDLSWYNENGKDMDGVHARNFDLPLIFPSYTFQVASDAEIYLYQKRYCFNGVSLHNINAPAYLGGYYDRWPLVLKYREQIRALFQPDRAFFSSDLVSISESIRLSSNSCAVHIRRGDLSVFNPVYGEPIKEEYFLNAIRLIDQLSPSTNFLLFSDEPDWVAKNIVPNIPKGLSFKLMSANDSSKGYLDLYLMCQCNHFIASQGSLAKYAMAIAGNSDSIIVEPKSNAQFGSQSNFKAFVI